MFVCSYCGHTTTLVQAMKLHMAKHINEDLPEGTPNWLRIRVGTPLTQCCEEHGPVYTYTDNDKRERCFICEELTYVTRIDD